MNNFSVWFFPDRELNQASGWKMPLHVMWIGQDQSITKNMDLPFLHVDRRISRLEKLTKALLSPVVALVRFNEDIYNSLNALSFAAAVICTAIAGTRARRYNFSTGATIGWLLFVFLLGVTGLLALLCAKEWPARVECPNCKKLRTVDREACEHCQSTFSPPEKNGTEIFAPLAKA